MNISVAKFPSAVLDDTTKALYSKLYGDAGELFVNALAASPDEIAVISRLLAYLAELVRE